MHTKPLILPTLTSSSVTMVVVKKKIGLLMPPILNICFKDHRYHGLYPLQILTVPTIEPFVGLKFKLG